MSWPSYLMIPPGKTEIWHIAMVCQGNKGIWDNESLGSPPQILQAFSPQSQDNTLVCDGTCTCDLLASVLLNFISHFQF